MNIIKEGRKMNVKKRKICIAISLLTLFVLWTVLVRFIDVKMIGPNESSVGFSSFNQVVHNFTGVNWFLYTLTDWLGLVPIAVAFGFFVLGFVQLIIRKRLDRVDYNILALGVFYIVVILVYLFFEIIVINYRPVLINGYLEASYPSSTTMLVMCVMPTAAMQFNMRIKNAVFRRCIVVAIILFIAFMVVGRIIAGVHWITDIIGGILFSAGMVVIYDALIN